MISKFLVANSYHSRHLLGQQLCKNTSQVCPFFAYSILPRQHAEATPAAASFEEISSVVKACELVTDEAVLTRQDKCVMGLTAINTFDSTCMLPNPNCQWHV